MLFQTNAFLTMSEKWKSALDKVENVCLLVYGLMKTFEIINHDLLLVKSKEYVFSKDALELICSYLKF